MATIAELANAIDGFLDNTADRRILSGQIKRTTRQIRRKETALQQDLFNEQQRRYNAERERDVRVRERNDAQGERDLAILAYNNERTESHRLQAELVNTQRERNDHRRTAHRLLQRYNTDTERWRRRHEACIRQAQTGRGDIEIRRIRYKLVIRIF